jgi:hypothetical protein
MARYFVEIHTDNTFGNDFVGINDGNAIHTWLTVVDEYGRVIDNGLSNVIDSHGNKVKDGYFSYAPTQSGSMVGNGGFFQEVNRRDDALVKFEITASDFKDMVAKKQEIANSPVQYNVVNGNAYAYIEYTKSNGEVGRIYPNYLTGDKTEDGLKEIFAGIGREEVDAFNCVSMTDLFLQEAGIKNFDGIYNPGFGFTGQENFSAVGAIGASIGGLSGLLGGMKLLSTIAVIVGVTISAPIWISLAATVLVGAAGIALGGTIGEWANDKWFSKTATTITNEINSDPTDLLHDMFNHLLKKVQNQQNPAQKTELAKEVNDLLNAYFANFSKEYDKQFESDKGDTFKELDLAKKVQILEDILAVKKQLIAESDDTLEYIASNEYLEALSFLIQNINTLVEMERERLDKLLANWTDGTGYSVDGIKAKISSLKSQIKFFNDKMELWQEEYNRFEEQWSNRQDNLDLYHYNDSQYIIVDETGAFSTDSKKLQLALDIPYQEEGNQPFTVNLTGGTWWTIDKNYNFTLHSNNGSVSIFMAMMYDEYQKVITVNGQTFDKFTSAHDLTVEGEFNGTGYQFFKNSSFNATFTDNIYDNTFMSDKGNDTYKIYGGFDTITDMGGNDTLQINDLVKNISFTKTDNNLNIYHSKGLVQINEFFYGLDDVETYNDWLGEHDDSYNFQIESLVFKDDNLNLISLGQLLHLV